jgi:hypothetical protein
MLLADRLSILEGDWRERADKSAVAAINRALRFTRKDTGGEVDFQACNATNSSPQ